MGAQCSDCVARTQFDSKVQSLSTHARSSGRKQLLENNVGADPAVGYEITDEVIGVGRFGEVRLAISRSTKERCALKAICKTSRRAARIQGEIDILSALDHPHIVRLFDVYEDWRNVYVVFEICSGGEVLDQILSRRRFDEKVALSLLAQLLDAVKYFHAKHIAHRNIKLDHIILKDKGQDLSQAHLKVIDFGLAQRFTPGTATMKTKVGSPTFIAPEILYEDATYDEKVDVWSAGVIGYIMFSGGVPFSGESIEERLDSVRYSRLKFPEEKWRDVSQKAKDLITSMLTRKITSRVDAHDALERVKESMKPEAHASNSSDGDYDWVQWRFTGNFSTSSQPQTSPEKYFDRFSAFGAANRFVKSGWHLIARHMDAEQLEELQDIFKRLDIDDDGVLTVSKVKAGFHAAGVGADTVAQAFSHMHADEQDKIDYIDFVAGLMDKARCKREELWWEAFRTFDRDLDGHIGIDDLHAMLQSPNEALPQVTKEEVDILIRDRSKDGDRRISFQDFVATMAH